MCDSAITCKLGLVRDKGNKDLILVVFVFVNTTGHRWARASPWLLADEGTNMCDMIRLNGGVALKTSEALSESWIENVDIHIIQGM